MDTVLQKIATEFDYANENGNISVTISEDARKKLRV